MTKTYTREINPNSGDSHQTSPHWVVTFVRFDVRDTFYFSSQEKNPEEKVRNFLIVENDCIAINVNTSKTNYTPQATVTLLAGDLNYSTAVHPGDFFTVNMVNFSDKAREIRTKIENNKPINKPQDGFKGIFKVNAVSKIVMTDPGTGQKTLRYQVTGYAFTEFNHSIYYNAALGSEENENALLYQLNDKLLEVLTAKQNVQEVLELLPTIILGQQVNSTSRSSEIVWEKKFPYIIPKKVFTLLGIEKGMYAIDMYKIILGVWGDFKTKSQKESDGFNPKYKNNSQYQLCPEPLSGNTPIQTSSLTNVSLLELMKRYSNELINEMYVCFRLDKDSDSILPKLIIRQKPFTTLHGEHAKQKITKATHFLKLPRWKISPDLIYSINVSRNESLRFNFVQITGTTGNTSKDSSMIAYQASEKESVKYDEKDIRRHGLRPYVRVCNFDWPTPSDSLTKAPYWTSLVFDWVYGGHLKLNGTIECVGLEENICIGDNLELQDTVYHIESISHTAAISADGKKSFRTNLRVTEGYDKRSSSRGPVYPEMDFTDTLTDRVNDYNSDYDILPGFSDAQDIPGRSDGEEVRETKEKTFSQPSFKNKK
jgi:hypothetical protein